MGGSKAGDFGRTKGAGITKHGQERIKERNFSESDIIDTKTTTNIKKQGDGATVYIKELPNEKYNVIVEGSRGIITVLKNISKKALERLSNNYKWR